MNANLFAKTNAAIKACTEAYFAVIDEQGYPSVSTVSVIQPQNLFEIYFSTSLDCNKTNRLRNNSRASLCFKCDYNITLVGEATILTDQATKSKYWQDSFINHYAGGETDPNYCIIKFTTQRVSLWLGSEGGAFTIDELLTVQSRCGLLCTWCTYKEPCNCKGCIAQSGKPFWGECDVAQCCQDKGYSHCGECADIPCDNLRGLSYGDDEHNDRPEGARIEVCQAWAIYAP